ncbi:hypothetical protein ACCUM_2070 [Candidatus Accumulibacter phosphatis]|uniref:Uncharacterized protein n=1 Tax=Candidatus Accumulibacter phosphatis TaxID=327160 RepID=A0A5S4EI73_9PROT|nr:hypothetical protein ACCUM_2070 [Candidatus Accumulibacter phosphatis]
MAYYIYFTVVERIHKMTDVWVRSWIKMTRTQKVASVFPWLAIGTGLRSRT